MPPTPSFGPEWSRPAGRAAPPENWNFIRQSLVGSPACGAVQQCAVRAGDDRQAVPCSLSPHRVTPPGLAHRGGEWYSHQVIRRKRRQNTSTSLLGPLMFVPHPAIDVGLRWRGGPPDGEAEYSCRGAARWWRRRRAGGNSRHCTPPQPHSSVKHTAQLQPRLVSSGRRGSETSSRSLQTCLSHV